MFYNARYQAKLEQTPSALTSIGALGSHCAKTTTHWDPIIVDNGEKRGFRTGCPLLTCLEHESTHDAKHSRRVSRIVHATGGCRLRISCRTCGLVILGETSLPSQSAITLASLFEFWHRARLHLALLFDARRQDIYLSANIMLISVHIVSAVA